MPSQLSKQQIKQLQMSLNKKGMNSGHVDGIWGPITATAVRNFQKEQNINANGHLTRQTLAALGVKTQNRQNAQNQQPNKKGFVGAGPSETTGQGSNMGSSMGSHSSKSNAMSKPSTAGQGSNMGMNSNNSNTKQSNQKPNQIKANPSNQSGQMKKTKQ
ncbi:MAG: peptidoglycan-binding domain-containing protein [Pseudolabrys sp.]